MPILESLAAIRAGTLTPLDLVEQCLAKIDEREEELKAWVLVDREGALRQAEQRMAEAKAGSMSGLLHGIPLGVKDIVDVAGMPTRAGAKITPEDPAARDAPLVARLRVEGAIILGKTVTTEFACFDPPPTQNPWHPEATPGGSSSGSAVAVAAGMCLGAIGSQTGGSITRPASYCGVAGCKPTFGRVNIGGVVPIATHLDHPGPLGRTVADLALLLHAMASNEADDPLTHLPPHEDYVAAVDREPRPPRLGLEEGFFLKGCDPASHAAMLDVAERFRQAGGEVVRTRIDLDFSVLLDQHRCIMEVEAAEYHRPWYPGRKAEYGPKVASLLEAGHGRSAVEYAAALRAQPAARRAFLDAMSDCDALLTAATPGAAPLSRETTGDPRFNAPFSFTGLPTVSIPYALTDDGLPLALQLAGRPFSEALLFEVAHWCEQQVAFSGLKNL